ncbi:MAG: DUF4271 domain-containing protein [Muricauda sp.]|nr:DUF4271 domain-containing protein [Allomuricauda sp.]MAU25820.1 DUF4271 domain-containing protein [Allomuricauda sp.]MBC30035.1 DUF4271 domain-containing protein [Allomuricauda sp.]|tara:strand:- start:36933 stop:37589 length:657 start_codon:yes stop_codon:yes gene_type:complete
MNPIARTIEPVDWMTILIFLGLLLLTLGKYLYQTRFMNFLILPFNNKYISLYNKKGRLLSWFHLLMTLFQIINISLFAYLALRTMMPDLLARMSSPFLMILAITTLFLSIKIILQLTKGYVFNTQSLVKEIIYHKLSYFNYSGLIMFAINIFIIYVADSPKHMIYGGIFLIMIINIIGLVNILKNHQKVIISNVFYFILYLCTLEIAPFVLISGYLKH